MFVSIDGTMGNIKVNEKQWKKWMKWMNELNEWMKRSEWNEEMNEKGERKTASCFSSPSTHKNN